MQQNAVGDLAFVKELDDRERADLPIEDQHRIEEKIEECCNRIQKDKERKRILQEQISPLKQNMDKIFEGINLAIDNKLYLVSPTILQEWIQIKAEYPNELERIHCNIVELNRAISDEYLTKIQPKYMKTLGKETQYELDVKRYIQRTKEIIEAESKNKHEQFAKKYSDVFKK